MNLIWKLYESNESLWRKIKSWNYDKINHTVECGHEEWDNYGH